MKSRIDHTTAPIGVFYVTPTNIYCASVSRTASPQLLIIQATRCIALPHNFIQRSAFLYLPAIAEKVDAYLHAHDPVSRIGFCIHHQLLPEQIGPQLYAPAIDQSCQITNYPLYTDPNSDETIWYQATLSQLLQLQIHALAWHNNITLSVLSGEQQCCIALLQSIGDRHFLAHQITNHLRSRTTLITPHLIPRIIHNSSELTIPHQIALYLAGLFYLDQEQP